MVPLWRWCVVVGLAALPLLGAAQEVAATRQEASAPKKELTLEERGDIYMARKMFREAIEAYQGIQPQTAVVQNKIGIAYQQQAELDQARKYYVKAMKTDPQYAEAINNLGTVYYGLKSYGKSIRYYKKALQFRPNSASIYSNLGTAWFARHKYKQAIENYQKAMEIDPDIFERHGSHGVMLEERDIEERAKFNYYMAKLYAKQGKNELALQYIRKALEGGFKDKKKFEQEDDFAGLRKLPEFEELMKLEPRVL